MPKLKLSPSILNADFKKINAEIAEIEKFAEMIHLDAMDGKFVPNKTFGSEFVSKIKTKLPLDCHLMIENPEAEIEAYAKAGASIITFHFEAVKNPKKLIDKIHSLNCKAGISIKPATPVSEIKSLLDSLDLVLVMGVEPGFGGQKFMESCISKIKKIRTLKPELDIEVDGGINKETLKTAKSAGANVFVVGSAIFSQPDRKKAILEIRKLMEN
ncbi:MAG: ribulose-phosphate 3-epimerase [Candidatus Diapherotrites archaeon]